MDTTVGSSINQLNRPVEDRVSSLKENDYYKQVQEKLAANRDERGIWVKAKGKTGDMDYYLDVSKLSTQNYFTTVKTHEGLARVPLAVKMILGEQIKLRDRMEGLMESYMKSVVQSTSHNLVMSRIGSMRMASLAFLLALLGVPAEELKKLKKQAIEDAIAENYALFEENMYNVELLEVLGGGGKKGKAERSVLDEIQKQILTQAKRLNMSDYYTQERILEIRVKVDNDIRYKFREEEQNLQYELDYYI